MSHLFVRATILAALIASVAPSAQAKCSGSIVLYTGVVNADTMVDSNNPSSNAGSDGVMGLGYFWGNPSYNLLDLRTTDMHDALKSIKTKGACVNEATLHVYTSDPQGDTPQQVELYTTESFDASVVTWNTGPNIASFYDSIVMVEQDFNSFDIINLVEDWAPGYSGSDWGYLALIGTNTGTDYEYWNDTLEAGSGQEAFFKVWLQLP
ncbi:MAG: hypothetical protein ACI8RZ_005138 [Myxococcota bacterium]|jgi:hypothetical protein